jgi:hypothetical protein
MSFAMNFGVPEMAALWQDLYGRHRAGTLKGADAKLFKRIVKALKLLEENPRHPGLQSHEIEPLSRRFGRKVFQSYLENKTPSAGRIFWSYGPGQGDITIVGVDSHPEDKKSAGYDKVRLSTFPE